MTCSTQVHSDVHTRWPILVAQRAARPARPGGLRPGTRSASGGRTSPPTTPIRPRRDFSVWRRPYQDVRTHRKPLAAISPTEGTRNTPYFNPGRLRRYPPRRDPATTPTFLDTIRDRCENVVFYLKCDLTAVAQVKRIFAMSQKICRFSC